MSEFTQQLKNKEHSKRIRGCDIRKNQFTIFTNQLQKELFSSINDRNLKAAKNTLAAINQIINEEIKSK